MDAVDVLLSSALRENSRRIEASMAGPYEKSVLAIVCGSQSGALESFASIKNLAAAGYNITLLPSESAEKMWGGRLRELTGARRCLTRHTNVEPESLVCNNTALIIATLSVSSMSKIAAACFDNFPLYMVCRFMLEGKKIIASDGSTVENIPSGSTTGNKALAGVIKSNMDRTVDMGIKYVKPFNIHGEFDLEDTAAGTPKPALRQPVYARNVLSSADISKCPDNSRFVVKKGVVVTPAAKDYAGSKKISIVFQ